MITNNANETELLYAFTATYYGNKKMVAILEHYAQDLGITNSRHWECWNCSLDLYGNEPYDDGYDEDYFSSYTYYVAAAEDVVLGFTDGEGNFVDYNKKHLGEKFSQEAEEADTNGVGHMMFYLKKGWDA